MERVEQGDIDLGVPYSMDAATKGCESPRDGKIDMQAAHEAQEVSTYD